MQAVASLGVLTNIWWGRGAATEDPHTLDSPHLMATPTFGRAVVSRVCATSITRATHTGPTELPEHLGGVAVRWHTPTFTMNIVFPMPRHLSLSAMAPAVHATPREYWWRQSIGYLGSEGCAIQYAQPKPSHPNAPPLMP